MYLSFSLFPATDEHRSPPISRNGSSSCVEHDAPSPHSILASQSTSGDKATINSQSSTGITVGLNPVTPISTECYGILTENERVLTEWGTPVAKPDHLNARKSILSDSPPEARNIEDLCTCSKPRHQTSRPVAYLGYIQLPIYPSSRITRSYSHVCFPSTIRYMEQASRN